MAGWDYETQAREQGYTAVCGCDEAALARWPARCMRAR